MTPIEIAKIIDHTLLKPEATNSNIENLCKEAEKYSFFSVCVNSSWVPYCYNLLKDSHIKICTVVGFPLGATSTDSKVFETTWAVNNGADEIDMVINIGLLKSGNDLLVENDIKAVKSACKDKLLKVIIETALLTNDEKVRACMAAKQAGADYVKTSTGFSSHGATIEDVILMRKIVGKEMGLKAAGGVRSFEDAINMINAGATRLGTSGGIKIISKESTETDY